MIAAILKEKIPLDRFNVIHLPFSCDYHLTAGTLHCKHRGSSVARKKTLKLLIRVMETSLSHVRIKRIILRITLML